MHPDTADKIAEELSELSCVESARSFVPGPDHPHGDAVASGLVSATEAWRVEFTPARTKELGIELPYELLNVCVEHDLEVWRNPKDETWEASQRDRDPDELVRDALLALGMIVDEAADKRRPVSGETVDEAVTRCEALARHEDDVDEAVERVLEAMERIESVARSHSAQVDHTAVQDIVNTFERDLVEAGYL